jgi:hypothetical protein
MNAPLRFPRCGTRRGAFQPWADGTNANCDPANWSGRHDARGRATTNSRCHLNGGRRSVAAANDLSSCIPDFAARNGDDGARHASREKEERESERGTHDGMPLAAATERGPPSHVTPYENLAFPVYVTSRRAPVPCPRSVLRERDARARGKEKEKGERMTVCRWRPRRSAALHLM